MNESNAATSEPEYRDVQAKPNDLDIRTKGIMRPGFRFKVLASAGREAGLTLGLGCALVLNTIVSAANVQNVQILPTNTPDTSSTESPKPSPRPVDQAHVMADVGYHFANLWFAAEDRNWPLAQYYLGETRSHLAWAVSIHPVRKTSTGTEVDLKGILDAIDNSLLSEVGKAIQSSDTAKFKTAYQQTLVGCYACHTACEKPFLRLQIPAAPAATIINFAEPTNSAGLSSQAEPPFPSERVAAEGKAPGLKVHLLSEQNGRKTWVLAFLKGDEVMAGVTDFARSQHLTAAHLNGIGAFSDATLAWYDLARKSFRTIPVRSEVEVVSLIGNVTADQDNSPLVHIHCALGDPDGNVKGGHLLEAHVSVTLEIFLTEEPSLVRKAMDEESGLKLIEKVN